MSDFYQVGVVATFHRFEQDHTERLEAELAGFARLRPIALVLPTLASELDGTAMPHILDALTAGDVPAPGGALARPRRSEPVRARAAAN